MIKLTTKIQSLLNSSLLAVSLISIQSICHADEYEKKGMPCVKEICVGDGLDELSKVKWDKVDVKINPKATFYSIYAKQRDERKSHYRGNVKNLSEYIGRNKFDSVAVKYLPDAKVVCQPDILNGLEGTYTSKDGNLTTVAISLIPSASNLDSLEQRWTVTSIKREYLIKSEQQRKEVISALNERYGSLKSYGETGAGTGEFKQDKLNLSFVQDPKKRERMSLHPSCGGIEQIKVD